MRAACRSTSATLGCTSPGRSADQSPTYWRSRRSTRCGRMARPSAAGSGCRRAPASMRRRADAWDFPRGTKLWKEFAPRQRARDALHRARRRRRLAFRQLRVDRRTARTRCSRPPQASARSAARRRAGCGATRFRPKTTAAPATKAHRCRCWASARCSFRPIAIRWLRTPKASRTRWISSARRRAACCATFRPALLARPPRIAASTPAERAALGYLHGNCGNCHNEEGPLAVLEMTLAQRVAAPAAQPRTRSMRSIVGVRSQFRPQGAPRDAARIAPGHLGAQRDRHAHGLARPAATDAAARHAGGRRRGVAPARALDRNNAIPQVGQLTEDS